MDPFLKRVFYSVAALLLLLWFGLVLVLYLDWAPAKALLPSKPSRPIISQAVGQPNPPPGIFLNPYQVGPGETFEGIAKTFQLKPETLRSLNEGNDGKPPLPGSTLWIPSKDGIYHAWKPGQSLGDLARIYGVSLKEILRANQRMGDGDIKAGDVLFLPGAPYFGSSDPRWVLLTSLVHPTGFLKPTTGRFADGFGERIHPLTGKKAFHEGVDLAPGRGARVVASQDGTVLSAGIRAGYGRLIVLDHGGGISTWYAHLDEMLVKPGQGVRRGELIGRVGRSGRTTGPHLHFEVRVKGKPVNPFLYLAQ